MFSCNTNSNHCCINDGNFIQISLNLTQFLLTVIFREGNISVKIYISVKSIGQYEGDKDKEKETYKMSIWYIIFVECLHSWSQTGCSQGGNQMFRRHEKRQLIQAATWTNSLKKIIRTITQFLGASNCFMKACLVIEINVSY